MRIVFPDRIDFDNVAKGKIRALNIKTYDDAPSNEATIIERIHDAELIAVNFISLTRRCIDAAPNLRYVISAAVGYDGIDYEYAASKGITVLNCPTQNANAVAEMAITLMFAVSRKIVTASGELRAGKWTGLDIVGTELSHKKLGLIGYGRVGKLIEQKVGGLQMRVTHVDSRSSTQELDSLIKQSDVICLCLTLNSATRRIIDEQRLTNMQPHSILINIARGDVIDQRALIDALEKGTILGAGIDVYENEPASGNVPDEILQLATLPNVVATPHIAYNTQETIARLGEELFNNIESCIAGKPINVIGSQT
jgi:phosphoglycerate dehydrogenase-like enzyme